METPSVLDSIETPEMVTTQKIEETVKTILKEADMDQMTEFKLRLAASTKLGFDLSETNHKKFVRDVLEAFLLSNPSDESTVHVEANVPEKTVNRVKEIPACEAQRFIYKFSENKDVMVDKFSGKLFVSIGKMYPPEYKRPFRGKHFPIYQWSELKKHFGAIEDAIKLCQSKSQTKEGETSEAVDENNSGAFVPIQISQTKKGEPSEAVDANNSGAFGPIQKSQTKTGETFEVVDANNSGAFVPIQKSQTKTGETSEAVDANNSGAFVPIQKSQTKPGETSEAVDANNSCAFVPIEKSQTKTGETFEAVDTNNSGAFVPIQKSQTKNCDTSEAVDNNSSGSGFVPIETSRFDGKDYHFWASQMELFLKQMNLSYVLFEPSPGTGNSQSPETNPRDINRVDAAGKDWLRDDYLCHNHLLKSFSDHLYRQYSKKFKHAKELWDELKWVYQCEESNSKRSQVKKYIEFTMVEERPILEQVQDFNKIADSIVSAGMFLDETFHVSTIISKFPLSWRGFCTKIMEEEFLPVWMLMERVKAEEEYLRDGVQRVTYRPATGSGHMERRASFGTTHRGSQSIGWKRKEPERDGKVTIVCENCGRRGHLTKNCWGKRTDERAFKKPNQGTSLTTAPVVSELTTAPMVSELTTAPTVSDTHATTNKDENQDQCKEDQALLG